jgi:pimeloyl-ACP methyl ester carboxylesterase
MPADRSGAPEPPTEGTDAADADRERFVFGGDPARDRWWGRPLAETRWCLELGRLLADPVWHGRGVPRGDGRPVVLMPGFLAGDQTLRVIAAWLRRFGYRPRFAGFVTNTDCSDRALDRVERTVDELWAAHGRRVALIGHSRGGHFARALAARRPSGSLTPSRSEPTCRACSAPAHPPCCRQRRPARCPRQRTGGPRHVPLCSLRLSVQPRLRTGLPL